MVFASPIFLGYFLPLVLGGYYLLPATGPARNRWLLGVSYVFYGWWDPRLVPALFVLTLATFGLARWLGREDLPESRRRLGLAVGVGLALAVLFVGKYLGFAFDNYDRLAATLGWAPAPAARWALPLGISFFTFHAISTLVDVHRRDAKPMASLVDFACYLAFFPQLIAGPILRFGVIAPAYAERRHSWARVAASEPARNSTQPSSTRTNVASTRRNRGRSSYQARPPSRRSVTSNAPCQSPQATKVHAAPCQSPPSTITISRFRPVRIGPRRLPPSGIYR